MVDNLLKGKWNEVKDKLKARWSKVTDDDLKRVEGRHIEGRHEELASVLQQRYSLPKDQAESDSKAFFADIDGKVDPLTPRPASSARGALTAKPAMLAPATKVGKSKI